MLAKKLLAFRNSSSENFEKNFHEAEKMQNLEEGGEEAYRARAGRKRHSVQLDKKITQQLLNLDRRSSTVSTGTIDSLCKCRAAFFAFLLFLHSYTFTGSRLLPRPLVCALTLDLH